MSVHTKVGDCIMGKRLVYEARETSPPLLARKGRTSRTQRETSMQNAGLKRRSREFRSFSLFLYYFHIFF